MLNIGKLAKDGGEYYLGRVASSVEDYYLGRGEAPGRWLGGAAADLGLAVGAIVDADQLRRVLAGRHPHSGQLLSEHFSQRTVPGFDLAFRAPKSVSLLWALGERDVSNQVREAHDVAVEAALGYLERHAAYTRRGKGGAEQVPVDGFVAAAFRHRTSRADDPLLHTHVLVANLAYTADDDRWRTLDGRHLYLHAKTAGFLYQAQLRHELTHRLGVAWGPVTNGYADLDGVPRDVIEAFSRRRAQILEVLDERGETSAAAAQIATLATRSPKTATYDGGLHRQWTDRADELGFDAEQVAALVGRQLPAPAGSGDLADAMAHMLGPEGLTRQTSTFNRRDVLQGWCEQLDYGATVGDVERLADWLADGDREGVIALDDPGGKVRRLDTADAIRTADGRLVAVAVPEPRYTTPELLATEARLIDGALARRTDGVAVADPTHVHAALAARPSIADEQAAAVRHLTGSGSGVDVLVGKAGTGKTFTLGAARQAWAASGATVVGCALSARAALELQSGSGIASTTICRLLNDLDRRQGGLPAGGVLVVDEAGMVGTRTLARLFDHAEAADAKVVLVGDHRQLPEIDAGGAFAALAARLPGIELTVNRRQIPAWERAALDGLRDGDLAEAIDSYTERARITVGDDPADVRRQLIADWAHTRAEHGGDLVIVAARRDDVADLNRRARQQLAAAGELSGPGLAVAGRTFQAGDRIVCLQNRRRLGVVNGTRGTVTGIDTDAASLTFLPDDTDSPVVLPEGYLAGGHVDHAYAITAHKAQGLTCDETFVLADDAIYREWGYVALSRGRHANRIYVLTGLEVNPPDDPTHPEAHQHDRRDALDALTARLRRTRRQQLALDQTSEQSVELARSKTAPARPFEADRSRDHGIGLA